MNVLHPSRSDNSQLDKSRAFRLNSFKEFSFDFVKSKVCNTIALFKLPTNTFKRGSSLKGLPKLTNKDIYTCYYLEGS